MKSRLLGLLFLTGDEASIHVYTSCGQRLLQVGNDAVLGQGAACVNFGSSGISIELGFGLINVLVSYLPTDIR